jgi:hypothetical protein
VPLTLVSYSFVERGGPRPACAVRDPVDTEVAAYFEAHVVELKSRPTKKTVPLATFANDGAERFRHLAEGSRDEFVATAQALADRLYAEMQPTTAKKGFFVALRREGDGAPEGVVLKLDASDELGAAIQTNGEEPELAAIKNLLDSPGALQKGAVFPDTRSGSDVIIGERWDDTTQYFLRALDVVQSLSERASVNQLLKAVQAHVPDRVPAVLEAIAQREEPTDFETLLAEPDLLEQPALDEVLTDLRRSARPLLPMHRDHVPLTRKIQADGITITGPVLEFDQKVSWARRAQDLGWRITIDVRDEPRDRL